VYKLHTGTAIVYAVWSGAADHISEGSSGDYTDRAVTYRYRGPNGFSIISASMTVGSSLSWNWAVDAEL
jgi:hypothetical protein